MGQMSFVPPNHQWKCSNGNNALAVNTGLTSSVLHSLLLLCRVFKYFTQVKFVFCTQFVAYLQHSVTHLSVSVCVCLSVFLSVVLCQTDRACHQAFDTELNWRL